MASPHPPDGPSPADGAEPPALPYDAYAPDDAEHDAPRIIRLRVAAWDVVGTLVLLILLVVLATATTWPSKLFGFLNEVCTEDTCGPVPFAIDLYIYPVVWGGVGAAVAAVVIGPFVSLLKGWYMSFWPLLALAVIMVSAVAGSMLTTFSQRYWH